MSICVCPADYRIDAASLIDWLEETGWKIRLVESALCGPATALDLRRLRGRRAALRAKARWLRIELRTDALTTEVGP